MQSINSIPCMLQGEERTLHCVHCSLARSLNSIGMVGLYILDGITEGEGVEI